ncbi:MAG: hypothetical protein R3F38_14410 [Gammaproteobacteria bacterium]
MRGLAPGVRTLLQNKSQGVAPAALALGFHRGLVDRMLTLVHYFWRQCAFGQWWLLSEPAIAILAASAC